MTEERIAQLEALCREAEKEPWHTDSSPYNESAPFMVRTENGWVVAEGITYPSIAQFIAEARTALPELLAEARRLQAENAQIRQVMDGLMEIASRAVKPQVTLTDIIRFHNSGRVPE